jgi:NAD(P)H-dependent FMN reductase
VPLDLRDWRLPFFQEHRATIGDFSNPTYSDPVVRGWNRKVAEGDAFLIVSAEYNHSALEAGERVVVLLRSIARAKDGTG